MQGCDPGINDRSHRLRVLRSAARTVEKLRVRCESRSELLVLFDELPIESSAMSIMTAGLRH